MNDPLPKPVEVTVRKAHVDLLRQHRFFTKWASSSRTLLDPAFDNGWNLEKPQKIQFRHRLRIEPYSGIFKRGYVASPGARSSHGLCSIGFGSYSHSPLPEAVSVGRYSSLSNRILFLDSQHPLDRLGTGHFSHKLGSALTSLAIEELGGKDLNVLPYDISNGRPYPTIGHDVWVGQGALIALGVTLGHGCVVAAESVVTKDVAPYSIVGGNPARHIRYRFPDELVARLLASEWWRYSFTQFAGMSLEDPPRFLDALERRKASGDIAPYEPEPLILPDAWLALDQA
jgi:acetyltransferase-like isoleucine patch superfamily enzyme